MSKFYKVVGGVLSPTHDAYQKSSLIPATHRLEMARSSPFTFSIVTSPKFCVWKVDDICGWVGGLLALFFIKGTRTGGNGPYYYSGELQRRQAGCGFQIGKWLRRGGVGQGDDQKILLSFTNSANTPIHLWSLMSSFKSDVLSFTFLTLGRIGP